MTEWQQKGYDAWVELWIEHGCSPTATQCPARYMIHGPQRQEFIEGWNIAKKDNEQ